MNCGRNTSTSRNRLACSRIAAPDGGIRLSRMRSLRWSIDRGRTTKTWSEKIGPEGMAAMNKMVSDGVDTANDRCSASAREQAMYPRRGVAGSRPAWVIELRAQLRMSSVPRQRRVHFFGPRQNPTLQVPDPSESRRVKLAERFRAANTGAAMHHNLIGAA